MAETTAEWMAEQEAVITQKVDTDDPRLENGGPTDWTDISNKPVEYTPAPHSHAGLPSYVTLANGATAMALATNSTVKVTPTANATYTTTVPPAGTIGAIIVLTSGTTSRTITFGTGFKPVGTLATGTTSARVFVIHFISDGNNLYEMGRTAAMAA